MFIGFIEALRRRRHSGRLKEHLLLLEALDAEVIALEPEQFYYLAAACSFMTKARSTASTGCSGRCSRGAFARAKALTEIPEEWLRRVAELYLTPEQMAEIEALGSWDEIMEALKQRLAEQEGRHQGGNKWIGTGGTSPFGHGFNPEGVRIGQETGRQGRAIKVWDSASFATSTGRASWARATSRSRCGGCGGSRAKARPTNWISTRRSTALRGRAGSTSTCAPSGTMR